MQYAGTYMWCTPGGVVAPPPVVLAPLSGGLASFLFFVVLFIGVYVVVLCFFLYFFVFLSFLKVFLLFLLVLLCFYCLYMVF